jgi:putative oxygen-independent coproporphyrinogen III oxidase
MEAVDRTRNGNPASPIRWPETVRHAYVHVPFCPQICPFCPFHVVRRTAGVVPAYLARLDAEAGQLADRFDVHLDTTYLGGGTPSSLRADELGALLDSLRRSFGSLGDEVTLEIHPGTAGADRLRQWRDLGVTRFSIGVESTDDAVLARLGRSHDAATALGVVEAAVELGVGVSVDLITAVGGQDVDAELATVAALGVDHVSAYTLTIEEGTPFERDGVVVDPEDEANAFDRAGRVLGGAGLTRYEVSNHARPGHECRHNLGYWRSEWWLGLGPSAAAHLPPDLGARGAVAVRSVNARLDDWIDGESPEREPLEGPAFVTDALIAGLRLVDGVDLAALSERSGLDVRADRSAAVERAQSQGLVEVDGAVVRATSAGLRVLDHTTALIVDLD